MQYGLNKRRLGMAAVAVLALAAVRVEAADVRGQVPFSFAVQGVKLPPGRYVLSTLPGHGVIIIRGASRTVAVVANPSGASNEHKSKLVFHKYGDDYFLRRVGNGEGNGPYDLRETGDERDRRASGGRRDEPMP